MVQKRTSKKYVVKSKVDPNIYGASSGSDSELEIPEVLDQRLGRKQLPVMVLAQLGNIEDGKISSWSDSSQVHLAWDKSKKTVYIPGSNRCFAGWDKDENCYLEYDGEMGESEFCIRINKIIKDRKTMKNKSPKPEESKPEKKTSRKSNTIRGFHLFIALINDFISEFLEKQGRKVTKKALVEAWQDEEVQEVLAVLLKLHLPESKVRTRQQKDPNAPKRPRTSYIYFCLDKRDSVKAEMPNLKATEITSALAAKWRELPSKKKKKYEKQALADKERYTKEMENYTPLTLRTVITADGKVKKRRKVKKGPKRPTTSYLYFCKDYRSKVKAENPDMKVTEVSKELGRMWREEYTSEKDRRKWLKLAAKDKKRYEKEKEDWVDPDEDNSPTPKKKRGRSSSTKSPSKSIVSSGIAKFIREQRSEVEEENPEWGTKQVIDEVKKRWKEMDDEERAEYG